MNHNYLVLSAVLTLALNKCNSGVLVDMLFTNKKFNSSVLPAVYQKKLLEYESSHENMIRSVSVYYSGGVAGKKKYRKIYEDSSYKKSIKSKKCLRPVKNCPPPRLVPYHKLMGFLKTIPLGKIYSVHDNLCDALDDSLGSWFLSECARTSCQACRILSFRI